MNEMFRQSLFAGVTISLIAYEIGLFLKRKLGLAILNPLLVSIVIVILALKVFGISYEVYNASAKYISYLLTPATVCLAVPLYEQLELLKKTHQLMGTIEVLELSWSAVDDESLFKFGI